VTQSANLFNGFLDSSLKLGAFFLFTTSGPSGQKAVREEVFKFRGRFEYHYQVDLETINSVSRPCGQSCYEPYSQLTPNT